ncbi:MAG TPA: decarboxylating 6-phosphogluconate dehydrogenase [Deltaproteobacteria bacterium]|nr:MAG: 6-phosphogluconate dehydrogenase (decarboxylating) [Deltaproteobacteria bacterium GWA2_65_63]OGP27313.1 MAG: 6-phosphogluconate dehydrogenase (decarboxylating) [Deltaproteobacteria bacterium GWB2_65_81]OGP40513.1 MAG: 6-phosphogluconate dehydrogenase (decarboxylating) [Deltaproteobacteria bacterium GWC2_66_88]HAM33832.1 decarboxylating 6-phosphogluconate dehydrogenase [Deltaproteobacteria bacterium]HBG73819.1 decarboxylating 6-phosphogluconate dehydrogenase [Deltaproteobacteria bacteriu
MQLGMVGLGRMGANMVRRLMRGGHSCVVFDRNPEAVRSLETEGADGAHSLSDFVGKLSVPRAAWAMVPAGPPTEAVVRELAGRMTAGDVIVDGGNSHFKDDVRRSASLAEEGILYCDAGTSGGLWGIDRGYCLMIGGTAEAVSRLEPVLRTLAPGRGEVPRTPGRKDGEGTAEEGYLHCGPAGAGHFVKMIHNGIEYGLMQAYAEGFDILRNAGSEEVAKEFRYDFDLPEVAELWRRGSVVGSWLLDLAATALRQDPLLSGYTGFVHDSGEGRWTVQAAVEEAVPADCLTSALYARFRSRKEHTFAEKVLSALRHQFGGHVERPSGG